MDAVRRDLYAAIFKHVLLRPPTFEVAANFLKYRASMLMKRTEVDYHPISIVFYTNKTCNFSCSFCYNRDVLNQPDAKSHDLKLPELRRILENPFGRKALRVAFLGGEPFLNPQIFDFFDLCHKARKISNVVSNASQLKGERLVKLVDSKVTVIGLSLYENNSSDVARVVEKLNASGRSYWVQTIAAADDLGSLEDRVRFARDIGCRNLILSNYNPEFDGRQERVVTLENREYPELEARLKREVGRQMNVQWMNRVVPRSQRKKSCRMPFSYIHVDNRGDIGPCCFRYPDGKRFGNVFSEEGWNAEPVVALRRNLLDQSAEPLGECRKCENLGRDLYGV
jgi:MoaA/NifB/PqqE/SkfB family radical SAM enzyme